MASQALVIGDILDIRHPEAPRWDAKGHRLWFVYRIDGRPELWSWTPGSETVRASREGDAVALYAPDGAGALYSTGGTLVYVEPGQAPRALFQADPAITGLDVSPAAGAAFVQDGRLWLLQRADPERPVVQQVEVAHSLLGPVAWSPNGERVVVAMLRHGAVRAMAVLDRAGAVLYETPGPDVPVQARFLNNDTLVLARMTETATRREVVLVTVPDGKEATISTEEDRRGIVGLGDLSVAPTGDACCFIGTVDGYPHLLLWEAGQANLTTLLPGPHEDHGEEHETPSFSADGTRLAFSSSHGVRPQDRRVFLFDRTRRTCEPVTEGTGTQVDPVLTPDGGKVAYLAASSQESLELWVGALEGGATSRVTRSMPGIWHETRLVEPDHLTLKSLDGFVFHADLYRPLNPRETPGPALVYVHGGPMRQMRAGFHPMHPYAVFHAWNQYLLQQGYTILSIDYRGGTGYGVDFERGNFEGPGQGDLADVIAGSRHLKTLPEVDPARVGIWGLSYGGYLTLLSLTKYPEEFRLGVNLAGMWTYPESSGTGRVRFWERRLGGPRRPETERHYHEASPAHFAENLRAPLLNLHGTADESVEFQQLDQVVRDLTRLHKRFELMYYPGETHFFHRRETWEDAFFRMERAFSRDLARWDDAPDEWRPDAGEGSKVRKDSQRPPR